MIFPSKYRYCRDNRLKNRSTTTAGPVLSFLPFNNLELSIGVNVSATRLENNTAAARVIPNSRNRRPTSPSINDKGTNTATSTSVVAITANPISLEPSMAARRGFWPSSIRLNMFSSTTIASSTTRPIANTRPNKVNTLMVYPIADITVNVAITDTGTTTAGISVAIIDPRKI